MTDSGNKYTQHNIPTTIAPWLTVSKGKEAVEFYKTAFGAIEQYRLETPDGGVVVMLTIEGAAFWVSGESKTETPPDSSTGSPLRMILTVSNPDHCFAQALAAGAAQIFAVGEEHGWRLGRLVDPFGFHWEIGRPL